MNPLCVPRRPARTLLTVLLVGFAPALLGQGQPTIRLFPTTVLEDIRQTGEVAQEMETGLQAVIAWIISLPLLAAIISSRPLNLFDGLAAALVLSGILFESIADAQLAAFKAKPDNQGSVMKQGLWRYTRHPNYFGECCVWWGFYLFAVAAGGWWSMLSPLLMTFLLLRVSGVALLERDIVERRPAYRQYIEQTNAFIPGLPKNTRKEVLQR